VSIGAATVASSTYTVSVEGNTISKVADLTATGALAGGETVLAATEVGAGVAADAEATSLWGVAVASLAAWMASNPLIAVLGLVVVGLIAGVAAALWYTSSMGKASDANTQLASSTQKATWYFRDLNKDLIIAANSAHKAAEEIGPSHSLTRYIQMAGEEADKLSSKLLKLSDVKVKYSVKADTGSVEPNIDQNVVLAAGRSKNIALNINFNNTTVRSEEDMTTIVNAVYRNIHQGLTDAGLP
jgi:hypothetical protein